MKTLGILTLFVSLSVFAGNGKTFGKKVTIRPAMPLAEATKNFKNFKDQEIAVRGKVEQVCSKKGCWMNLKDKTTTVRTMFKPYGLKVPKDILGKTVKVQGKLKREMQTAASIRHFMKDAGKPQKEIDKVKEGRMEFKFVAEAVEIL